MESPCGTGELIPQLLLLDVSSRSMDTAVRIRRTVCSETKRGLQGNYKTIASTDPRSPEEKHNEETIIFA